MIRHVLALALTIGNFNVCGQISSNNLYNAQFKWETLCLLAELVLEDPDTIISPADEYVVELIWENNNNGDHKIDPYCKSCKAYHLAFQLIPFTAIVEKFIMETPTQSFNEINGLIERDLKYKLSSQVDLGYFNNVGSIVRETYFIRDLENKFVKDCMLLLHKDQGWYNHLEIWRLLEPRME